MYSALKQGGQRLYELARRGIEVERLPRQVTIHEMTLLDIALPRFSLRVRCSKGTYIRTLVEDIAHDLGSVGHVVALRRVAVGAFRDERTWSLGELADLLQESGEAGLDQTLLGADVAIQHWPAVQLGAVEAAYVLQGQAVFVAGPAGAHVRMYDPDGRFMGTGRMTPEGRRLAPVRLMVDLPGDSRPGPGASQGGHDA